MTDEPVMVKMKHVRESGMCSRGAREFFRKHELDWNEFLTNGLPAETIEATGDHMAIQVAKVARNGR